MWQVSAVDHYPIYEVVKSNQNWVCEALLRTIVLLSHASEQMEYAVILMVAALS